MDRDPRKLERWLVMGGPRCCPGCSHGRSQNWVHPKALILMIGEERAWSVIELFYAVRGNETKE